MSACLARPKSGLKVNSGAASEGATTSKKENVHTMKVVIDKDSTQKVTKGNQNKLTSETKEVHVKLNSPSKLPNDYDMKINSQGDAEVLQTSKPSDKRKVGKNKNSSVNPKPSKKERNNRMFSQNSLGSYLLNGNCFLYLIIQVMLMRARKRINVKYCKHRTVPKGKGKLARIKISI